jgi:hypothetical protein
MRKINVLIIDAAAGPSLYNPVIYSDFIDESDNMNLLILSNSISQQDKERALVFEEIKDPTINGMMEVIALDWHHKYEIDLICERNHTYD